MTSRDKILCTVYAVLAAFALVSTQIVLFGYIADGAGLGDVWPALTDNGAVTFTTIDLLVVAVVGLVFMVAESRRLGLKRLWLYVLLTFAVAISVAFPLFLIERQRHLATVPGAGLPTEGT